MSHQRHLQRFLALLTLLTVPLASAGPIVGGEAGTKKNILLASIMTGLRPDTTKVLENATHFRKVRPEKDADCRECIRAFCASTSFMDAQVGLILDEVG